MTEKRHLRTYRVRQLPAHVNEHTAALLLTQLDHTLGPLDNIHIRSLAVSFSAWDTNGSKVATVDFQRTPESLDNDGPSWRLPARKYGLQKDVLIDIDFLGFTTLSEIVPNGKFNLDCIAISGLASHAFGSWRSRHDTDFMWLRDQLPQDFPGIRTVIYGFDSKIEDSDSFQNIDDLAMSLVSKLRAIGGASPSGRPLIFLAHSLGGIILKRALLMLAVGGLTDRELLYRVSLVVMFGVPNKGMQNENLLSICSDLGVEDELVGQLGQHSNYLSSVDTRYMGIAVLRDVRLISVFETKKSGVVEIDASGRLRRTNRTIVLVDRESAIHVNSSPQDTIPIHVSHSDMVKFSVDDENYASIASCLHSVLQTCSTASSAVLENPNVSEQGSSRRISSLRIDRASCQPDDLERFQPYWRDMHPSIPRYNPESHSWSQYVKLISDLMMRSLWLDDLSQRKHSVKLSCPATFGWVFDPSLGFMDWLEQASPGFWIKGKPGSGKSTMMKYILEHWKTLRLITDHSRERKKVITASFFFHDRGSYAQKSLEGFLQSLVFQILTEVPELTEKIIPIFSLRGITHQKLWTLKELETIVQIILNQDLRTIQIFVFLDALDECDGPPTRICELVHTMVDRNRTSQTIFSICCSGRPLNALKDSFDQWPGFSIHDHTFNDIKLYTQTEIQKNPRLYSVLKISATAAPAASYEAFVSEIVSRAHGVFVWVSLTIQELVGQCVDGVYAQDVIDILQKLPDELVSFYDHIIAKIPPHWRLETFVMLEAVMRSRRILCITQLNHIILSAGTDSFDQCVRIDFNQNEIIPTPDFVENVARRIRSRTAGLLELVNKRSYSLPNRVDRWGQKRYGMELLRRAGNVPAYQGRWQPASATDEISSGSDDDGETIIITNDPLEVYEADSELEPPQEDRYPTMPGIQFMHQSVKDYIAQHGVLQKLSNEIPDTGGPIGHGSSFLFKSDWTILAFLFAKRGVTVFNDFTQQLLGYGQDAELSTGVSQRAFINSIDYDVFKGFLGMMHLDRWSEFYDNNQAHWRLAFAVIAGLELYVREMLPLCPSVDPLPSLMHCLVEATLDVPPQRRGKMIQTLFELGPRTFLPVSFQGDTVLGLAFEKLSQVYTSNIPTAHADLEMIVSGLLRNGQNPNVHMHTWLHGYRHNRSTDDSDQLHIFNMCTPLHMAVVCSFHKDLGKMLLEAGAEVNAADWYGDTPLDWLSSRSRDMENYGSRALSGYGHPNPWFQERSKEAHYGYSKELLDLGPTVADCVKRDQKNLLDYGGIATEKSEPSDL